jgi:FkbM family methyltransferase
MSVKGMNFSLISNNTLAGRALRLPLRLLPHGLQVPILQGRLRGKKWIVNAGVHGYWLGSYEYEKRRAFERAVSPGSVVFDVGAHAGFYTLLASELVGSAGKVVAFEPLPHNLAFLRSHLELNAVGNVEVIEAAVSDVDGVAGFQDGLDSSSGSISSRGARQVATVSLDALVQEGKIPTPDFLKIDVEGAEMLVLRGARCILEEGAPALFLATHGKDVHARCCEYLKSLGYVLEPIVGKTIDDTDEVSARRPR